MGPKWSFGLGLICVVLGIVFLAVSETFRPTVFVIDHYTTYAHEQSGYDSGTPTIVYGYRIHAVYNTSVPCSETGRACVLRGLEGEYSSTREKALDKAERLLPLDSCLKGYTDGPRHCRLHNNMSDFKLISGLFGVLGIVLLCFAACFSSLCRRYASSMRARMQNGTI